MESFALKIQAYDPLDRDIPKEGDNQAMKTAELKSEIEKLTSIQAERLDVPINE